MVEHDGFGGQRFRWVATKWVGQGPAATTSIENNINHAAQRPNSGPAATNLTSP